MAFRHCAGGTVTDRLTPADPADRAALFAAYAAAKTRAAELGVTVYDDSIIRAAYEAVRPLLLEEGRRQSAGEVREAVLTAVQQTLRTAAFWLESDKGSEMLAETACAVKRLGADPLCCPVCEEIKCDEGCPLETLRAGERAPEVDRGDR